MSNKCIKKWTVLIYADGNNEMEDVIYKSFTSCSRLCVRNDINVIIEIGLLGQSNWSGVRRYYINSKEKFSKEFNDFNITSTSTFFSFEEPILIESLGKLNMADPNNLSKFITWGMKAYPAEHYMVILSGHGTDFVGCFTDLSFNDNYIMGIPEMANAIYLGSQNSNSSIDILVLDMCFMNSIEVLYEFSQYDDLIKTIITYTNFAPYEGLDYPELIKFIDDNANIKDLKKYIAILIDTLNFNLTAYRLDKIQLNKIKKEFNNLALFYLTKFPKSNSAAKTIEENQPMNYLKKVYPQEINEINNEISSIIIQSKTKFLGINSSIKITSEDVAGLISFYNKLAFSKNNYWTNLLSSASMDKVMNNVNKVKVRTINSTSSTIHYLLPLNSTLT